MYETGSDLTPDSIYIMTNSSMPGFIKVGMSKKVPTERAAELSTTGVPVTFQVQYFAFFDDMVAAETIIHKKPKKFHLGKEFFKTDVANAISMLESINIPFKIMVSNRGFFPINKSVSVL